LGQIRVPSAPAARRCVTAVPTARVCGKIQLFSPAQPMVRASVHSASGWKKREQKRPVLGAIRGWQSSAELGSKAVDRMGAPEPVEVCEALLTQPIAVLGVLECV
jgi:hypothetical protein